MIVVSFRSGVFSEGPHMVFGNGSYLMVTAGGQVTPEPVQCTGDYRPAAAAAATAATGTTPSPPTAISPGTGLFSAPNPSGPWTLRPFNISHMVRRNFDTACVCVCVHACTCVHVCVQGNYSYHSNPSLFVDPVSGTAYLAFRTMDSRGETIGLATAPAWDAPVYTSIAEPIIPGMVSGQEDPFVWVQGKIVKILTHAQVRVTRCVVVSVCTGSCTSVMKILCAQWFA